MVTLEQIANPQEMRVSVSGPGGANTLIIFTGTAVFTFKGTGSSVERDTLSFTVGPAFPIGQLRSAVATASLASISNSGPAVDALWAVDSVSAVIDVYAGRVRVTADLAVRDIDGFLLRMAYQVNVLAALGPYSSTGTPGSIGEDSL